VEGDRRGYENGEKEGKRKEHGRKQAPNIKRVSVIHNTARKHIKNCIKYVHGSY
jgi:hypothetical protein